VSLFTRPPVTIEIADETVVVVVCVPGTTCVAPKVTATPPINTFAEILSLNH
jgi:hypothetical protein